MSHDDPWAKSWVQPPSVMWAPSVTLHGLGTHFPTDWTAVSFAEAHVTFWLPDTV
jgi:hypothetical protein